MENEHDPWSSFASRRRDASLRDELVSSYVPFIVEALAPRGGTSFIILYGSRARGDYAFWSDTDLVVCSPAFEHVRVLDRTDILEPWRFSGAMEIVCYAPGEAERALDRSNPTMLDALEEGVVLHQDGDLLDRLHATFSRLKATRAVQRVDAVKGMRWKLA